MGDHPHSPRRRLLPAEDHAFIQDPRAALAVHTPRGARLLVWTILLVVVVAVIWASRAELDEVTRGSGQVIPSRQTQTVQSLDGGVVSEILVREGEIVDLGQVLVRIDDTRFASSAGEKRATADALRARIARLNAESDGTGFSPGAAPTDMVERERALYEARQREQATALAIIEKQADQRRQELAEQQTRLTHLERALALVTRELDMTRPLRRSGAVSEVEILRLERKVVETQAELESTKLVIPRIESQLNETLQRRDEQVLGFRNQARSELNRAAAELAELEASSVALTDRVERTAVRSPVRGTVNKLWVNTIGGVVAPGMIVAEVVPLEDSLLIEARIRPSDIAFLRPGQPARVKISAYDSLIYGVLDARLEHISADTLRDTATGSAYYLIRVRTDRTALGAGADSLPIIPGMLAEVDILTGSKTVLHYLIKPVLRAKETALRER